MKLTAYALIGLLTSGFIYAGEVVNTGFQSREGWSPVNWQNDPGNALDYVAASGTISDASVNNSLSITDVSTDEGKIAITEAGEPASRVWGNEQGTLHLLGNGASALLTPVKTDTLSSISFHVGTWDRNRVATLAVYLVKQDDTEELLEEITLNFSETNKSYTLSPAQQTIVNPRLKFVLSESHSDSVDGGVNIDDLVILNASQEIIETDTLQTTTATSAGKLDQKIIGLKITTNGDQAANSLKALNLALTGFTHLDNLKLYYTGNSNIFTTTGSALVTETSLSDTQTLSLTTPQELTTSGEHFFWIAGDIKSSAPLGSQIDVACNSLQLLEADGTTTFTETPTTTDPAGFVAITDRNVVLLNGTSSKLVIADDPAYTKNGPGYTTELWFKTTDDSGTVYSNLDSTNGGIELAFKDNALLLRLDNGPAPGVTGWAATYTFSETYNDGEWHHIAIVMDETTTGLRFYVNGQLVGSYGTDRFGGLIDSANDIVIGAQGAQSSIGGGFLNGSVADVRLWNVARTETELQESMYAFVHPQPASLVGYWQLSQNQTTAITGGNPTATDLAWEGTDLPLIHKPNVLNTTDNVFSNPLRIEEGAALTATGSGLEVADTTSNLSGGQFVLFATTGNSDQNTSSNAPTDLERTEKAWYLAPLVAGATLDLTFKLSDINNSWILQDVPAKYKLFYRDAETATYADLELTPTINSNDGTITFANVAISDGFYALGSDGTITPVVGLNVEMTDDVLSWSAAQELGVSHYQVEQWIDGVWTAVTTVQAGIGHYAVSINPDFATRLSVVDTDGFTQTFLPTIGGVATTQYPLAEGWNLLSMSLANADLSELLAVTEGEPMIWNGEQYEVANVVAPGQGFFVYTTQDTVVTITGQATTQPLMLQSGWNLAGVTENTEIPANVEAVYVQDKSYQNVLDQGILIEGVGYWIYVK